MSPWTFLTDHAHVLVLVARDPRTGARELARATGLEAHAVAAVLRDLEAAGYIHRRTDGRSTYAIIDRGRPLRHPIERHHPVGRLLDAVQSPADVLRDRLSHPN